MNMVLFCRVVVLLVPTLFENRDNLGAEATCEDERSEIDLELNFKPFPIERLAKSLLGLNNSDLIVWILPIYLNKNDKVYQLMVM